MTTETGMKQPAMGKIFRWGKYVCIVAIIETSVHWARFTSVHVFGHKVIRGEIKAEVIGTGTLESRIQTVISSRISEKKSGIFFDRGEGVEKGEMLMTSQSLQSSKDDSLHFSTISIR